MALFGPLPLFVRCARRARKRLIFSVWLAAAALGAAGAEVNATSASDPKEVGRQLREALGTNVAPHKKLTLTVGGKDGVQAAVSTEPSTSARSASNRRLKVLTEEPPSDDSKGALAGAPTAFRAARAKALGLASPSAARPDGGWSYNGETGPQSWAQLKPEFRLCSSGKRQAPIAIKNSNTLIGPAAAIDFHYTPTGASVYNDGRTISVTLAPASVMGNTLEIRGTRYRLTDIEFHTPAEVQIDGNRLPMAVHLLHKSDKGQMAILVVLLQNGESNAFVNTVWTYLPLDTGDRVDIPDKLLNVNEILPADQRYFQFIGSLSKPPCTENVLWLVMSQALTVSPAQYQLFTQLFEMNARPLQPSNGRPVRGEP